MPNEKQKDNRKAASLTPQTKISGMFNLSSSLIWALIFTLMIAGWIITGEFKGGSALKSDGVSIAEQSTAFL